MRDRVESIVIAVISAAVTAVLLLPLTVAASYVPIPSGTMAHFNAATCPTGWTEFAAGQGYYIVNRVAGGTLATPVVPGSALTNQEDRTHTHTITASGVLDLGGSATNSSWIGFNSGSGHLIVKAAGAAQQDNNELQAAGGAVNSGAIGAASHSHGGLTGANAANLAPYIQLLFCSKN